MSAEAPNSIERLRDRFEAKTPAVRRTWVLRTLMLGSMISLLDATIVNVSTPAIMRDFGENISRVQWVISAYMIAFAVLMPLTGWLRLQIGGKKLYLGSLIVFTVGSLLCGLAWNLESLIFFRIVQALGGGAMTPIAMAIISDTFPTEEKGRALGLWGAGVLIGPILGPPLGGFLTELAGWRSIFFVNIPVGLVGILAAWIIMRKERTPARIQWSTFDFTGFTLLSGFLISLLYGASLVEHDGIASRSVFICGFASMGFFVCFLISELRSRYRVLDFSLFRSKVFGIAIAIALVRSFALYGGQFLLPLFLAGVQGYSESQIGWMILPGAVIIAGIFPFSGRGSDRYGAKPFIVTGLVILLGFFVSLSFLQPDTSFWGMQIPILIRGIGLGLLVTPLTTIALTSVPSHKSADGSVLINLAQQLGGSLGIASLGSVIELQSKVYSVRGVSTLSAVVMGYRDAFRLGVVVCALALALAFLMPGRARGRKLNYGKT